MDQRKIPVDLHFSTPENLEQPAGVFAGCGAVSQAKIKTAPLHTPKRIWNGGKGMVFGDVPDNHI